MKIELIYPAWEERVEVGKLEGPPLSLALIAALTPPDIEVHATDERVESVDFDRDVDLVGITAMTLQAKRAYEICEEFRKRGIPVVMGGIHPTILPDEARLHSDALVIGEAELVWNQLLGDLKKGNLNPTYKAEELASMEHLPIPRWDLFKKEKYLTINHVQTSRGCPYNCEFCAGPKLFGSSYRCRPIEEVVEEVRSLTEEKRGMDRYVSFVDDNIAGNPAYAKKLFKALKPLNVPWWAQACITMAEDEELVKLAAESGCFSILLGIESILQENLKSINKNPRQKVEKYAEWIDVFHRHGIVVWGSFIFGLDHDTKDTFKKTVDFAIENNIELMTTFYYTPYPATPLYERAKKEGRLLKDKWWQDFCGGFTWGLLRPKLLSVEETTDGIVWTNQKFYGRWPIFRRVLYSLLHTRRGFLYVLFSNLGLRKWCNYLRR